MTPSEIEPATFQLVAQCLNKLRLRVPLRLIKKNKPDKFCKFTTLKMKHVYVYEDMFVVPVT
jgi:hypothetical protein